MKKTGQKQLTPHIVESLEIIGSEVYILSFKRSFDFIPGQVVALSTDKGDSAPRIYSICSGKDEPMISILFNVVPGGKLTNRLVTLKKGDTIYCSEPYGSFSSDSSPAYWIASGTGIAPFYSMFKSGLGENKIVIHGGRSRESFYFQDKFEPILKERYIRCSSTAKEDGLYPGRLTHYLKQSDGLETGFRYYLCGSAEMVVEARDILIEKGIPYEMILSEIYF
jgi:ferredoxin--NADP+ reductase